MNRPSLLQADDLGKVYGSQLALDGLTFGVAPGRHLAVIGPSGCGKSTLLRLLAGLEAPTTGRLKRDGVIVSEPERVLVPPHQRRLAMVFQDLALWPDLTATENIKLGLHTALTDRGQRRERARETLDWCGLEGCGDRYPAELSIGQQQRVAIARALAVRPELLLLDEPFSSLDWLLKGRLLDDLASWCARLSVTVVLVTHDPDEALALCPQALVLDHGRRTEHGSLVDLLQRPSSPFLSEFVRRSGRTEQSEG